MPLYRVVLGLYRVIWWLYGWFRGGMGAVHPGMFGLAYIRYALYIAMLLSLYTSADHYILLLLLLLLTASGHSRPYIGIVR